MSRIPEAKPIKPQKKHIKRHNLKAQAVQPSVYYKPKAYLTQRPDKVKPHVAKKTFTHAPKKVVPHASYMHKPKSDYGIDPVFVIVLLLILVMLAGAIVLIIKLV